jgi:hypothetical protein
VGTPTTSRMPGSHRAESRFRSGCAVALSFYGGGSGRCE